MLGMQDTETGFQEGYSLENFLTLVRRFLKQLFTATIQSNTTITGINELNINDD